MLHELIIKRLLKCNEQTEVTVNKESYLQSSKDQGLVISVFAHSGRKSTVCAIQMISWKVQLNCPRLVRFGPF